MRVEKVKALAFDTIKNELRYRGENEISAEGFLDFVDGVVCQTDEIEAYIESKLAPIKKE